jgi:hypothetical protein
MLKERNLLTQQNEPNRGPDKLVLCSFNPHERTAFDLLTKEQKRSYERYNSSTFDRFLITKYNNQNERNKCCYTQHTVKSYTKVECSLQGIGLPCAVSVVHTLVLMIWFENCYRSETTDS